MKNSIFKNSIFKLILTACNIVFPLIVSPYIASLFNQSKHLIDLFGSYNDANGIMYIFLAFAVFGVYNYGIREASTIRDDKEKLSQLFTNLFFFSTITSVVTSIIYCIFIVYVLKTKYITIYLVMVIQLLGNVFSIEWLNEALENYKFITIKTIIVRIMYVISVFTFVKEPEDVFLYALIVTLFNFLNNLLSFIYIKSKIKFDFKEFGLNKYVKPLTAMLIINNVSILYTQLDKFFLGRYYVQKVAVTEYTLPLNAVNMIGSMLVTLLTVSVPRLSYHISKGDNKEYNTLLANTSQGFFMLMYPACIGLACVSYEAMYLYTNGAYAYTSDILALCSLRFLITSVYSVFSNQIMYIHHKEKALVTILLSGGALNIMFNAVLMITRNFTPSTAIISTTVAEFIMLSIMYAYIRSKMQIDYNLFSIKNMKYLCYSLPFIPITYGVKMYSLGIGLTFISIAISCMVIYSAILIVTKDEMLNFFLVKLKLSKNSSEITLS